MEQRVYDSVIMKWIVWEPTKFHFHLEEWKYDPVNDVMEYFNTLVRIKR